MFYLRKLGKAVLYVVVLLVWFYVAWDTLWFYKLILVPPRQGWWDWVLIGFGVMAAAESLSRNLAAKDKTQGWWSLPHHVVKWIETTLWWFFFFYIGWALLWAKGKVGTAPHQGWWDLAIIEIAVIERLSEISTSLEELETTHGFWGPYKRQAAIGVLFCFWVLGLLVNSVEWLPNDYIGAGIVFSLSGPISYILRTAGRRRDYPVLATISDFAVGAGYGGAMSVVIAMLWTSPLLEKRGGFAILMGLCCAIGGAINLWRHATYSGNAILLIADTATRGKTIILGLAWALFGGLILMLTWDNPMAGYLSDVPRKALFLVGICIGVYAVFARGLGPVVRALDWSQIRTDTHGKARAATAGELRQAGVMPRRSDAIYIGRLLDNGREIDSLGYAGGEHLVTIGRTGSGKGMGLIVPNLSTLRRSILIIDPKGEAAAITARKRATFGRVVMLNPFNLFAAERPWMQSEGFNPLATIRSGDNFVRDCTVIAQSLVKQEKGSSGRFFSGSAHDFVTALIMYDKLERKEKATLANVRAMLTEPFGGDEKTGPTGIAKTIIEMTLSNYAPLREMAGRFRAVSRSNSDILSTAVNETSFLTTSPQITRDLLSDNNFRFGDMKREIVTVYLIFPAPELDTNSSNWLRVMIASALNDLLATPPSETLPPVLLMLDEFAQLGHLPAISNAMNLARGFGVQLWPFVQDLNQLNDLYEDRWQNFLGASAVLTAFAPRRDLFTAEHLSKLSANKTIIVESENESAAGTGDRRGRRPEGAPLFRPEELMAMPPGQMLCWIDPVAHPFMARARGYWETPFNGGLDSNPYHKG